MEMLGEKLLIGFLAGVMVFVGIPLAKLGKPHRGVSVFLFALSAGIALFLVIDLFGHARELPTDALTGVVDVTPALAGLVAVLFVAGAVAGFLLLRWYDNRAARAEASGSGQGPLGGQALRLSASMAMAVGLYNFAQGMGIGQAALFTVPTVIGSDEGYGLLFLGFAFQGAAKGVAVAAPLVGRGPSWRRIAVLGAVAGLPTVAGVLLGVAVWLPYLFVGVLTFAGGAGLFAAVRAFSLVLRNGSKLRIALGVLAGLLVGVVTTFAVEVSQYSLPELRPSFWI